MTALVRGRGSEDPFTSDVVSECCDLTSDEDVNNISPARMPARQHTPLRQLQNTITELQSATPRPHLTIQQLQTTLASIQGSNPGPRQQESRPTVGGKCPRRSLPVPPESDDDEEEDETCESCTSLKRRVRELEDKIKQLQGEGNYSCCI